MTYTIKAIPTTYAGVNFRSRLEARWAAFFDLCGWAWDYEPFDLDGWAPDFRVRTEIGPVLAEVKPADIVGFIAQQEKNGCADPWPFSEFDKAVRHNGRYAVCLLGDEPLSTIGLYPVGVIGKPPANAGFDYDGFIEALTPSVNSTDAWREAGNIVQWAPEEHRYSRRRRAA